MSAPVLPMQPPLYPRRLAYVVGAETEAMQILQNWVCGRAFHPYGKNEDPFVPNWRERAAAHPAVLKFDGVLIDGMMRWSVFYWRVGDPEGSGVAGGFSHPADAARAALEAIEEHERAEFEADLVIGVA